MAIPARAARPTPFGDSLSISSDDACARSAGAEALPRILPATLALTGSEAGKVPGIVGNRALEARATDEFGGDRRIIRVWLDPAVPRVVGTRRTMGHRDIAGRAPRGGDLGGHTDFA